MSQFGDTIPPALRPGESPGVRPPLEVALAKGVKGIPPASALPDQMLFEPKFGGYRVLIFRDRNRASPWSRQGKDLTRYSIGVSGAILTFGLVRVQLFVRDKCRSLVLRGLASRRFGVLRATTLRAQSPLSRPTA